MNKKVLIILLIASILVIGGVGVSFAFYQMNDSMLSNSASSSCFKLTFSDSNSISLENSFPMPEFAASNLTPYKFTIKNTCNSPSYYDVNLEILNGSTISESEIRYKIDYDESNILGNKSLVSEYINNNVKASRNIINGVLNNGESKTYELKLWIDEESLAEDSANKDFLSKIVVISRMDSSYHTITFDPGNMIDLGKIEDDYSNSKVEASISNGVITIKALANDAYFGFPVNVHLDKNKKYHFSMDVDAEYDSTNSNAGDTVQAFIRDVVLLDRLYIFMPDKSYTFKSKIDGFIDLRLDVNQKDAVHEFSNITLKEVVDSRWVKNGQEYGELPNLVRNGYDFDGWYTEKDGGVKINSDSVFNLNEDQVLYAHWNVMSPF